MEETKKDPKRTPLLCSARMTLAIFAFLGFANMYAQRTNLSVGIVCMLNNSAIGIEHENELMLSTTINGSQPDDQQKGQRCPIRESSKKTQADGPFNWSKSTQGLILGAFFWGYLATQLLGGQLAERYSGKYVLFIGMAISSIGSLLCPVVAVYGGQTWFIVLRVIMGLGQGVAYPAFTSVWARWAPPAERSVLIGFSYAGSQAGNVIAMPVSGALCSGVGWESVFYLFGALSAVWCILWLLLIHDTPGEHKRISDDEMLYIQFSLKGKVSSKTNKRTPWKQLLSSLPVWAIVVAHASANFGKYLVLTMVPTFMSEVLRFDIKANGLFSACPYIAFFTLGNVATVTTDYLRYYKVFKTVTIRKIMNTIAFVGQASFLVGVGYLSCDQTGISVLFLTLSSGLSGFQYGGFLVSHPDVAGKYAGTVMGISNTFATIDGIIAPYITSAMTPDQTINEWRNVFWLTAAILLVGAVFYIAFGSADIQSWAVSPSSSTADLEQRNGEISEKESEKQPLLPKKDDE